MGSTHVVMEDTLKCHFKSPLITVNSALIYDCIYPVINLTSTYYQLLQFKQRQEFLLHKNVKDIVKILARILLIGVSLCDPF